jgi:uncharacterized protein YndB with AHSA1/START domain
MGSRIERSRDIAASPEKVYAAISDVTRMGEWSEECYSCEWSKGSDQPSLGATFEGHNRHGDRTWTTQCEVIEADPGRTFVFECSMFGFHYSTWGYRIDPAEAGCTVTEWSEDLRPESALELSREISGVDDRAARNRQTMSKTLDRLAAAVEPSRQLHARRLGYLASRSLSYHPFAYPAKRSPESGNSGTR